MKSDRDEPTRASGSGESRPQKKRRKKNTRWPGLPGPTDLSASQGGANQEREKRHPRKAGNERPEGSRKPRRNGAAAGQQARSNGQGRTRRPRAEERRHPENARRTRGENHPRQKQALVSGDPVQSNRNRSQQARSKQGAGQQARRSGERSPHEAQRRARSRQDQAKQSQSQQGRPRRPDQKGRPPRDKAARARAAKRARILEQQKLARRRRIIIFVAMIAGIILLAATALYLLNGRSSSSSATQEDPVEKWAPVACEQSALQAELEIASSSSVGSEIPLKVNLHNTSDAKPCYVDVGWDNVDITITSGNDEIVSSQTCEMGDESKQLLLDRDMETSFTLSWQGGRGCDASDLAQAGTYKATLTFSDGAAEEQTAVFTLE